MLVTPLADGMNLVAKEFVAAQDGADPGVLILSHFAGAAEQLDGALHGQPLRQLRHGPRHRPGPRHVAARTSRRWLSMMQVIRDTDIDWCEPKATSRPAQPAPGAGGLTAPVLRCRPESATRLGGSGPDIPRGSRGRSPGTGHPLRGHGPKPPLPGPPGQAPAKIGKSDGGGATVAKQIKRKGSSPVASGGGNIFLPIFFATPGNIARPGPSCQTVEVRTRDTWRTPNRPRPVPCPLVPQGAVVGLGDTPRTSPPDPAFAPCGFPGQGYGMAS